VALRADLDHDVAVLFGAARLEGVSATADHGGLAVGGMNVSFHGVLFSNRSPGRQIVAKKSDVNRNLNVGCRLCQLSRYVHKRRPRPAHSRAAILANSR
jgi:hypothetical protein